MYNPQDIMIDLETTGVSAGCCVLSIGACTMDGQEKFYAKISHADSVEIGLHNLRSTMEWWERQSVEARTEAFSGVLSPEAALVQLNQWMRGKQIKGVWGNGAAFDLPILGAVYEAVGITPAWPRFSDRCYRTLKNLYPYIKADEFVGVKHNALADALHQAAHARKIFDVIGGKYAS